jgi:hypothetical protein
VVVVVAGRVERDAVVPRVADVVDGRVILTGGLVVRSDGRVRDAVVREGRVGGRVSHWTRLQGGAVVRGGLVVAQFLPVQVVRGGPVVGHLPRVQGRVAVVLVTRVV